MLADAAVDPAPVFGSHGEQATPAADPAPAAPPPFRPPAPDWEAEERERLAREREQHAGEEQHESVAESVRPTGQAAQADAEPRRGARVAGGRMIVCYGVIADRIGAAIRYSLGPPAPHAGTPTLNRRVDIFGSDAYQLRQRAVRIDVEHDPAQSLASSPTSNAPATASFGPSPNCASGCPMTATGTVAARHLVILTDLHPAKSGSTRSNLTTFLVRVGRRSAGPDARTQSSAERALPVAARRPWPARTRGRSPARSARQRHAQDRTGCASPTASSGHASAT